MARSTVLRVSNLPTLWQAEADKVWQAQGEGVILKRSTAPYSPEKRNFDLMKIKEELTLDLEVIGMVAGKDTGKYANTLGGLLVRDKASNVHAVSGMTDDQRITWWNNQDLILGKVVEVKAMKRLTDGSLREPRFKAIRFDKAVSEID